MPDEKKPRYPKRKTHVLEDPRPGVNPKEDNLFVPLIRCERRDLIRYLLEPVGSSILDDPRGAMIHGICT